MADKLCKIHLDLDQGVVDVEGPEKFVTEQFELLKKLLLNTQNIEEKPAQTRKTVTRISRQAAVKRGIDLKAAGDNPSLLEFYDKARRPTFLARSLLFLYYLKNVKFHEKITTAHIKICYEAVKAGLPSNIYQNVIVGGGKKSWVDVSDTKDLKLTLAGIEEVEKVLLVPEKRGTRNRSENPVQMKKTRTRKAFASSKKVSGRSTAASSPEKAATAVSPE